MISSLRGLEPFGEGTQTGRLWRKNTRKPSNLSDSSSNIWAAMKASFRLCPLILLFSLSPAKLSIAYRYYGPYEESGIQLAKARHGNLQGFIDRSNSTISLELRWKWILHVTKPIVFPHGKGVMHSDLRLENYLVHSTPMDLWLCDLGGSTCEKSGLDGGHLPDDPFSDPPYPAGIHTGHRYLQFRIHLLHHPNRLLATSKWSSPRLIWKGMPSRIRCARSLKRSISPRCPT